MRRFVLLLLLFAPSAFAETDAELRVMNAVIDWHVEHARDFWQNEVGADRVTMIGKGDHSRRLVALGVTIPPRTKDGYMQEGRSPKDDERLLRIRKTALFRSYAKLRRGAAIEALQRRRDLLVIPSSRIPRYPKTGGVDPERFYERYPAARGLLRLSAPAISADGGEALVYADLLMVFSDVGRLFYLTKRDGRWTIEWAVEMLLMPGCSSHANACTRISCTFSSFE